MKFLLTSLCAVLPLAVCSGAILGKSGTSLFLLTTDNGLTSWCDSAPTAFSPPIALTGVTAGDTLVAIDVRPQNQQLYALGINPVANTFQLYHLSPETGTATAVGSAQTLADSVGATIPAAASRYGIDFNPLADRLRVVNTNGLNFRMNANSGGCLDGSGNPGVNPDAAINGVTLTVDDVAYTNNDPFAIGTTLYTLDPSTNSLLVQNPANNGTQALIAGVNLAGSPLDFSAARGFDLAPPSPGGPASGSAYAALTISGITALYKLDLTSGAVTSLATPAGFSIVSLAVRTQIPVAVALDATGANLIQFRADTPGTTTSGAVSVTPGETLVGIDFRPATGQLMGLGVNATADTATLYLLDPRGGTATAIGTTGGIALTTDGVTPLDLPTAATGYGFDFNPTADRLRVVTGSGLSFRINPVTGAPVDGSVAGGVNPDGDLNGGSTVVTAAAYTNSYANLSGATTLYTLDPSSNSLWIQNPPNNGTQTVQKVVKVNGSTLDFTAASGFDITTEGGTNAVSNVASPGYGWAALTVGGTARLYRIHLSNGEAVLKGQIGSGGVLTGFTIAGEAGAGFAPLSWPSVIGTSYQIETSEDLANWQPYPFLIKAAQTTTTVPVPLYKSEARRFWRAVSP